MILDTSTVKTEVSEPSMLLLLTHFPFIVHLYFDMFALYKHSICFSCSTPLASLSESNINILQLSFEINTFHKL